MVLTLFYIFEIVWNLTWKKLIIVPYYLNIIKAKHRKFQKALKSPFNTQWIHTVPFLILDMGPVTTEVEEKLQQQFNS